MLFLNNWKGTSMKAQIVVDTYDETQEKNASDKTCYYKAWRAAKYQGGTEIWNSNGLICGISSTPNRMFEFDDGSYVNVTYTGAEILTKEDVAHILTKEDLDDES